MERLDRRLAEAAAALATLDELAGKGERPLVGARRPVLARGVAAARGGRRLRSRPKFGRL